MARGKTIKQFLMDGEPGGRIKCSMTNWTGVVYKCPRTAIDKCKDMDILRRSGVYFLFGINDEDDLEVYIGQAAARKNEKGLVARVIEPHDTIDWTEAVMIATSNNSFGQTEISYLENRFYKIARDAKRYAINNRVEPTTGNVTEETECELEEFIDYVKIIMGTLGYKVFEPLISKGDGETEHLLHMTYKNANATGRRTTDGFVIMKGSTINKEITESCPINALKARTKHEKLIVDWRLTEDILLSSPSAAAAFVGGASLNGNIQWKDSNGKTLGQIEAVT